MAIKFGKKIGAQEQVAQPVATPVQEQALQTDPIAQQVDEAVKLKAAIDAVAKETKAFAVVKKGLQSIADEQGDPADQVELLGSDGNKVVFSAKADKNECTDMNAIIGQLKKVVSYDDLMGMISISQETVKQYLGEAAVAKYYKKSPNVGARTLKAVIGG